MKDRMIELECPLGVLRCETFNNDGEFVEFGIDLIRPDGGLVQVAVVGTSLNESGCELHVHAFNGDDECAASTVIVNPDGECIYR